MKAAEENTKKREVFAELATGDETADVVLRALIEYANALPKFIGEQYLAGNTGWVFYVEFLKRVTERTADEVVDALERLARDRFIKFDRLGYGFRFRVWLRVRTALPNNYP